MEKLRFAPIIRVSTEEQMKNKDSLVLQKKQIIQNVEILKGSIPDYCWKYSGQEHATVVEERKKLDRLLRDSAKGLFDAVIVCDASRWSRDNRKSKEGLEILRENNTRFFIGTSEYDLYSPEQSFFIGMATEIGEFQANQGSHKSIMVRIDKAKRGESATRCPVGRTFKNGKWDVKPGVKKIWENIAKEFLEGTTFVDLGIKYKMGRSYIRYTLLNRCGNTWEQKFHAPRFNIKNVVIPTKVPRLLPEETIKAVEAKVQQNKFVFRKQIKHKYLFTRMLLCGHCGHALYGESYRNGTRVYRHRNETFQKGQRIPIDCNHFKLVHADDIEESIMMHLFSVFGDINMIKKAAKNAIPDFDRLQRLQTQLETNNNELKKIEVAKNNLLDSVEEGTFDPDDIKERMIKNKERKNLLLAENIKIKSTIEKIPTEKAIIRKAKLVKRIMEQIAYRPSHLKKMTFEEKRSFLQTVFTMSNVEEKRPGIYLKKMDDNEEKPWLYEIKGNLNLSNNVGHLPMSSSEKRKLFAWYYEDELKTEHSGFRLAGGR